MTIRTLEVPGGVAFHSVVSKIRKRCECGSDPDGYFTYVEKEFDRRDVLDPVKKFTEKIPTQYFLGEGDIKILKGFFTPETGCRNQYEEAERRRFWWNTMTNDLFATCELTAPITFWATNVNSNLFERRPELIWDLSKYGEVPVEEFMESLGVSGTATFNYHRLSRWWRSHGKTLRLPLSDVMISWIEQLPYADLFICNENPYIQACV